MLGQRRYGIDVLGKLGFIGVAQRAGFKLAEIKELIAGVDSGGGMSDSIRSLSARKLDEVEELLRHTMAMKGWLEVAKECGCTSPAECALFPSPGEQAGTGTQTLELVRVSGKDCRRPPRAVR